MTLKRCLPRVYPVLKERMQQTTALRISMDFAKEYGFKSHDGAKKLYKNALNLTS